MTVLVRFAAVGALLIILGIPIALAATSIGWTLVAVGAVMLFYGPGLIAFWGGRNAGKLRPGAAAPTGYGSLLGFVLALIEKQPSAPRRTRRPSPGEPPKE